MNGDEAASWAAASEPDVRQVAAIERRLEPGKLALYDMMLHEWIRVFGDSLFAMRAMSAALGTIAIVLIFVAVRESWRFLADESAAASWRGGRCLRRAPIRHQSPDSAVGPRGGEYPLVMCAELLQINFFVRAQRGGGMSDYLGIAVFTAAMVADQLYFNVSDGGGSVMARHCC